MCLAKDDLRRIPIWVKLHDVFMTVYTGDELSIIASKLVMPVLLNFNMKTMCEELWGTNSYVRALIEFNAEIDFKCHLVANALC